MHAFVPKSYLNLTKHRSSETIPITNSFVGGGYMSNKKWPLNEECTTYINQFTLRIVKLIIETAFNIEDPHCKSKFTNFVNCQ